MSGALYVCYFGLREPLVQTQVLPYLRELAKGGERIALLTFEPRPWSEEAAAEHRVRLRADGIAWHTLGYHKRPSLPATLYDIFRGGFRAAAIARREGLDIFHGRSHVGAAIGALARKLAGGRLIFDIRGFLAEEYVDAGNWRAGGVLFRLTKAAERWLLRAADGFVVLTESARQTLFPGGTGGRPLEVIPCCVDPRRFAGSDRADLGLDNRVVYAYVGSLGGYYLTHETAELLAVARELDPRTFALVLTHGPSAPLAAELERRGFTRDDYRVIDAAPEEVPRYLRAADVGLAVMRPSFARRAMSPTKFAEYLAAGLPVIATAGIGDLDAHIAEGRVGALLPRHDRAAYIDALRAVEELRPLAERCREMVRARYDLEGVGGAGYRRLYGGVRPSRPHSPGVPPGDGAVGRGRPTGAGGTPALRVLALASYPIEAASSRFRIAQFIRPLAERGIDVAFSPFLDASLFAALYEPRKLLRRMPRAGLRALTRLRDAFRPADVVFVQREAMLFGPPVVEWLATRRRPMILDLDDATWIAYRSPVYGRLATLLKWPGKTDRLIRRARVVTCGNPNIAEYVRARGAEAVVLPTVVDTAVFRPRTTPPPAVPVVGWIGTHGTSPFLQRLLPLFDRLEMPFELVVIGSGLPIDARPWQMDREADDFRSLDVGVYPLPDDAWSAAKSGFKAVQYMASGVPFVMSPVGVCAAMGIPGETHLNAVTDDEWLAALRRLLADTELRMRMGRAGRAFAERHYSLEAHADALAAVIRSAAVL
jgi:glycosyltransferase involved in cell wall biosynthesis